MSVLSMDLIISDDDYADRNVDIIVDQEGP
jgi:hypothetical protein